MTAQPLNEPILGYSPGSPERNSIIQEIDRQMSETIEIPCIINGEEVFTGHTIPQVIPHNHGHILANVHLAGREEMESACSAAVNAQRSWIEIGLEERCKIFEKCADLLAGDWRMRVNASTMLNQSKTVFQAEIDSACELIDFWRFNCHYARGFHDDFQPLVSPEGVVNSTDIRPLEGFVLSITPFNFTSIAANLPSAPAIVGCTSVWKPSRNSYYSNYYLMRLMMEAGLPPGVINFLPGSGADITEVALSNPNFAGLHFRFFSNLPRPMAGNRAGSAQAQFLSTNCRRDGGQGLRCRSSRLRQKGTSRSLAKGGVRIPGAEVLSSQSRIHP